MPGHWDGIYTGICSHPFFDLEATVDDEEELDEEMENELEALFLDDSESVDDTSASDTFALGSSVPPENNSDDEREIARELRRRYASRNTTPPPSMVRQEALFSLAVKPNHEKDAVKELERIIAHRRKNLKDISFFSAASYEQYPGQVFIWAKGAQELKPIARNFSYMMHWKITLIEYSEWLRLLATLDDHFRIPVPSWVRVKRGLYRGDLAILDRSYSNNFCDILLVPRVFLNGRKRPKPSLFLLETATRHWGEKSIKQDPSEPNVFIARKMQIKAGLLSHYVSSFSVTTSLPKGIDELSPFMDAATTLGSAELMTFLSKTIEDIKAEDLTTVFRVRDRVRIAAGPFSTLVGIIKDVNDAHASVTLENLLPNERIPRVAIVPMSDLRRVFREGDIVRVISGFQKGRKGPLVRVDGNILTFLDVDVQQPLSENSSASTCDAPVVPPEVEFYSSEISWSKGPIFKDDLEFPTTIGQRVEVVAGLYKGSRGYAEGWDLRGTSIHVNLYFKSTPQRPDYGLQSHNPVAAAGKMRIPPEFVRRCFVNGDVVLKKGLPNARFIICSQESRADEEDPPEDMNVTGPKVECECVVRATYDPMKKEWVPPNDDTSFAWVPRRDLIMTETIHDPILALQAGHVWFEENMDVVVIHGPRKGYRGRVRKVLKLDVQIELQATQRVHKYKPKQLARVIHDHIIRCPPMPTISPIALLDSEAQPLDNTLDATELCQVTPLPTPTNEWPTDPAWDPHSKTPERPTCPDSHGSFFLLHPPFLNLLDHIGMMFKIQNSSLWFMDGKHEGDDLVRTVPAGRRGGRTAGFNEVLVYLNHRPSSLSSISVWCLTPAHAGPGDAGIVISGELIGVLVDVLDRTFDDATTVHVLTREVPARQFRMQRGDLLRVWVYS